TPRHTFAFPPTTLFRSSKAENDAAWAPFAEICNVENFRRHLAAYAPEWMENWKQRNFATNLFDPWDNFGDAAFPIPLQEALSLRSEEHTSELQSRENLV